MPTRKSMFVLFGILVISAWVLGSVIQAGAETLKGRTTATVTKSETIAVSDEPGHVLGMQILEGLAFFENGEIAKRRSPSVSDRSTKGSQVMGYTILTFEDGSTMVYRFQRLFVPDKSGTSSAKSPSELIKGTGRFEGIKGTISSTVKNVPASEGEAARDYSDITITYTLPPK